MIVNSSQSGGMTQDAADSRYLQRDTQDIQESGSFQMICPNWQVYTETYNNGIYVYEDESTNMVYIYSMGTIKLQGDVDMVQYQIRNMAEPTKATDAATKGYVDNVFNNVSRMLTNANQILDEINGDVN